MLTLIHPEMTDTMNASLSQTSLQTATETAPDALLASMLLEARRTNKPLQTVPETIVPINPKAAYAVQDVVALALSESGKGEIVGWKVGAATPTALPSCAPLHRATVFESGQDLSPSFCRFHGVEAEIAYSFRSDLSARAEPWTKEEVADAIGAIHGAIELLDTRFVTPNSQHNLSHLADQGSHGVLVVGRGVTSWRDFSPTTLPMTMLVNGEKRYDQQGGNKAGDPLRLLTWLANHAIERGRPLRAGDVVTTGSTMGTLFLDDPAEICVSFEGLFPVEARLGAPFRL
ncbi:2-keto-4-pentenoate hydratase [Asaia siamensis]|uniref:2-keto-4-pentenoate hydratase n=2 Tax=Asaia siamensis TaxID=110479 RepID=A0ABQ1MBM4_9PROT|nr:2-oxopent-4-enoate hydratase [Asaia siamensis NRIC 0323]GGC38074.1 2-keto-4-pentenoate hydratase [Asaia siamensis]